MLTILSIIVTGYSCIDPYTPDTFDYDEMLMIEGIIYDDPSMEARVTISRNIPLDRSEDYTYETGAVVSIECDDGTIFAFDEAAPGIYKNPGMPIVPETGRRYRLRVETADQRIFASGYEPYIPASPIDSITWEPEINKSSEIGYWEEGYRFYANATGIDNKTIYLRWLLDATYNYSSPISTEHIWDGTEVSMYSGSEWTYCWKDIDVPGIFLGNSAGMTENNVLDARLNFVSQYGDLLMLKYSLNVIQLSISESAYQFWYDLKKMIDDSGGLYETQPFRLRGNVSCISDPGVQVTGIFEVAGVTKTRVFVPRPTEFNIYSWNNCELDTVGTPELPWDDIPAGTFVTELDPNEEIYATTSQLCYVCTLRGGTNIKPAFWE